MNMTETEILQMFKDEGSEIDYTIFPNQVFLVFPADVLVGGRRSLRIKLLQKFMQIQDAELCTHRYV